MTPSKFLLVSLTVCALAACTPPAKDAAEATPSAEQPAPAPAVEEPPVETPVEPPAEDLCNAAANQSLIGSNAAAITLPADLPHRIYKKGDPVTLDYRPDRLNIVTDENGVVVEVMCG